METTEFILRENGTLTERTLRERDLNVGPSVLEALTEMVMRPCRQVLHLADWGSVHASVGPKDTVWTVAIERIPLLARFRLINGVLVPRFDSTTDVEMPLTWQAPKEVCLAFVVLTDLHAGSVRVNDNWLFACDGQQRGYRLPLPNLFEDCRLCTGNFNGQHPCAADALLASLEQFRKSKWNADLMPAAERSQKFFRFQPTNETFVTLPIESRDWTKLCDKVSTDILERVVL